LGLIGGNMMNARHRRPPVESLIRSLAAYNV
jgi:hypothetical protein